LKTAHENRTAEAEAGEVHRFTEEELKQVESLLEEHETWLKEKTAEQKKLSKREDAVLKTVDMNSRGLQVQKLVITLNKKKFPKKPVKSSTSTTSTTATSTTEPTSTSAASAEETASTNKPEEVPPTKHEEL
jgi:hypoxia up-regulated 1